MQPLSLGADIVMYSHSGETDNHVGVLTMNDHLLYNRLKYLQSSIGNYPSPFECFLAQLSLSTLQIRMTRQFKNGIMVAKFLETHCGVSRVLHPGLLSHPNHTIAIKQASGHTGMIAFYLKCLDLEMTKKVVSRLKTIKPVSIINTVESTITIPTIMFSSGLPLEYRLKLNITNNLLLLSVGCEDAEDLICDLNNALSICC